MKYQVIRHGKTVSRVMSVFNTMQEAVAYVKSLDAVFTEYGYVEGFPMYSGVRYVYTIQGLSSKFGIACSLGEKDLALSNQ